MLVRYCICGVPHLETVKHAWYDSQCAYFDTGDATLIIEGVVPEKWRILVSDMFVDGKLALPDNMEVKRLLKAETGAVY